MQAEKQDIEARLLYLVRQFLLESVSHRALSRVELSSQIERDLGIDSLGKVELLNRIEKHFTIRLPNNTLEQIVTLKELANIIAEAKPAKKYHKHEIVEKLQALKIDYNEFKTLPEALITYALTEPARPHVYFQDEFGEEKIITYGDLLENAKLIAQGLNQKGIRQGHTVAIMLPTSDEFFYSFFGVLLAGGIPVPIYPPFRPDQIEEYATREARILDNAEIKILITFSKAEMLSKLLQSFIPSLQAVVSVSQLKQASGKYIISEFVEDQPVLIQYTSGSTGDPKGVLLHHKNMLANVKAAGEAMQVKPHDVVVSWLPLYHDMGLMSWLGSLFFGVPLTIMSPLSFLQRPERWLWAIHYHRGTISAGPNFAYELCLKKVDDSLIEGLDLSSWRLALNGAEAINPDTFVRFYNRFKTYGFQRSAIYPVYGLAENTVALAFPDMDNNFVIDTIDKAKFEKEQIAMPTQNKTNKLQFICCGRAIPGHKIRIVDEYDNVLPDRKVGNLQFTGPSAMQGYYRRQDVTEKVYHDGWWDTGDLAYIVSENVYITGRKKDLIIKAGRNLYPQTIEEIVNQNQNIRKGCVAAFGVEDVKAGTERLVVVAEAKINDGKQQLISDIQEKIVINIGVPADEIIIVDAKTIPKTSSGKLQRSACKKLYISGELTKKKAPVSLQISKLFLSSFSKKTFGLSKRISHFLYTIYIGLIFTLTLPFVWLFILFLSRKLRGRLIKIYCRFLLMVNFIPLKINGKEKLRKDRAIIYASNHASYVDAIVLIATLPPGTIFVGKKELLDTFIIGSFFKNLGFVAVDRWELNKNLEDTQTIAELLKQKESICIFPEGTFMYATGLRPFKAGAFQLAVDTKTPICPIALQGTRKILRAYSYLFKPKKVTVTINDCLYPQSNDWQEVMRLKQKSREIIAKHCGEATLDIITAGPSRE